MILHLLSRQRQSDLVPRFVHSSRVLSWSGSAVVLVSLSQSKLLVHLTSLVQRPQTSSIPAPPWLGYQTSSASLHLQLPTSPSRSSPPFRQSTLRSLALQQRTSSWSEWTGTILSQIHVPINSRSWLVV